MVNLCMKNFKSERLMGESDYAPFNEAMCVNATTAQIFDDEFIKTRAEDIKVL